MMKLITSLLVAALSVPVSAGIIRHDTPDSWYTGFANDPAFNGVGLIFGDTGASPYSCSGTVINKNWVLTAGHCVNKAQAMQFYLPGETGWRFYEADTWVSHENFSDYGLVDGWDIGLMHFKTDFDVAPAQLYNGNNEFLHSSASVGFGYTGNGETGIEGIDYQRRAGTNIVDDIWSLQGDGDQILWSDFDHPTDPSFNFFDFIGADFDDLATVLEIMVAPGDSGGGVFIQENGQIYLAGVHSFITDFTNNGLVDYGDAYGSTRVSSFIDWIDFHIATHEVPEPGSVLLLMLGGLGLFIQRRRMV
ncbi:S1 family peptidase [Cellvibrio sp. QJXJ]|uniref:S1 family peptidase n=1 Tax=Cellvibrio sp. QJXJ TaxID=2964606 RepID=UPI0021C497A1|nr:S1 family peptidase [Cellvibrio sp. QJXJ]UUA70964.1 S1 family peptidase [Cellvibrio sp. QJXJ]